MIWGEVLAYLKHYFLKSMTWCNTVSHFCRICSGCGKIQVLKIVILLTKEQRNELFKYN